MDRNLIDKLDEYSGQKAKEVFRSLPYAAADEQEYLDFLTKRRDTWQVRLKGAIRVAANVAAILFLPLLIYTGYILLGSSDHSNAIAASSETVATTSDDQVGTTLIQDQETSWIEYVVNPGVKGKILLPCGSEVWLNSKSQIKCPATFDSTARRVQLSGEAYFKVKSNKSWPMHIETPNGVTAVVLGTEFNLTAYSDDPSVKLTLVNGEVEILKKNKMDKIEVITVKPFEEVEIFNDSKKDDRKMVDTSFIKNTSAWKDGYLIFSNTPMDEVIKIMERWYGVKFNPIDEEIAKFNFTARFKTESLTQILDLLSISSNIKYHIKGNTVTLFRR